MLESIDLDRKVDKADYKQQSEELELRIGALQRRAMALKVPVLVVFQGWGAAGKGTQINELILNLDPRGYAVHSMQAPSQEEQLHPYLWRCWCRTPARGRIAIFDRSWYRRVLNDRLVNGISGADVERAFTDILAFERQLTTDGAILVKFFLHISRKEQKRRLKRLADSSATAWRVNDYDREQNERYDEYRELADEMIARTDTAFAPWAVVEATDRRFATLKIGHAFAAALERGLDAAEERIRQGATATPVEEPPATLPDELNGSPLDRVDLSLSLTRKEYRERRAALQKRIGELGYAIYARRVPVVIVYQGMDAAGKGGNIRRLVHNLDPRGYEVVPIGAPNEVEKAHHYLWRFWCKLPKAGHITIFDRSWYERVLTERVEGFCTEEEWRRAYNEINEMERHWTSEGVVLLKFWLQIDADEQLRRFHAREQTPYKQWKITAEDWRNREKLDQYRDAVAEMLRRTSTPDAPWTVVPSNCKWYARVAVMDAVCAAVSKRVNEG
jgi:polyphosphate:AMP phosphotransferase